MMRVNSNCVKLNGNFEYLYLMKLSIIRNEVVWDKHYSFNTLTMLNNLMKIFQKEANSRKYGGVFKGENSRTDTANSGKLVSTFGA